ncbi:MAG TPA: hypothetical protein VLE53_02645 [Gemmatimonadaceae bacterium]|nr:hypothetical protein [Gemmatimonadaceae bacterium]
MFRRPAACRTRVMSAWPAALSLAALLVLPGCYRLAPLETGTPDAGSEVRLALTDAGSLQLAALVGPRVEALEGRTLEVSDSSLVLAVSSTFDRSGVERPWSNERLSVPLGAVDEIRRRELDRRKTWIVSGASVVGLFLVSRAMGVGQGEARIPSRDGGNVQK